MKLSPSFCCTALLVLCVACNVNVSLDQGKESSSGSNKLTIAVIPKGTTHEFWKAVHFGAAKAGEDLGVHVEWLGPLQEDERDSQISVVQNFITQRVDGICLAPLDSQALVASVRDAKRDGIPVVIFDSGLEDTDSYISYVATNNFHGGELAAEEMARLLDNKGNVILLRYAPGSESTTQREEGFLSKINEYTEIKVISSDQYAGATPELALDKSQQLLVKFRDQVDGIFVVNESSATGMMGALDEAGLSEKVRYIGFDSSPRLVKALSEGRINALVLQDPVQMGYRAVKTMVDHLNGRPIQKRVSTGEYVATTENMSEPEMDKLLNPQRFE